MDAGVLVTARAGERVEVPSTVFLIEAAETVLVDTSFGPPAAMAARHPGFDCHRPAEWRLEAVLGDEGYRPSDIDAVILTHLDWDHCYNLDLFDDIPVYVQREELAYARDPYPMHAERYEAAVDGGPPWDGHDLTPLDGETELCPGVVAFPSPGHTVGHQSVAVDTPDGTTVVAADALPTSENVDPPGTARFQRGLTMDDLAWWESATAIDARADRILPGHEWEILAASPVGLC